MARLIVQGEPDPARFVELVIVDEEGGHDGTCTATGCDWSVVAAHGYAPGLGDAVQAAEIHLDMSCPGRPA